MDTARHTSRHSLVRLNFRLMQASFLFTNAFHLCRKKVETDVSQLKTEIIQTAFVPL